MGALYSYYRTRAGRWPQHPLNKRGFCNLVGISRRQIKHGCFSQVFSAAALSCWPSHASKALRLIRCTAPIRTIGGVCFSVTSFCQVLRLIPISEITAATVISLFCVSAMLPPPYLDLSYSEGHCRGTLCSRNVSGTITHRRALKNIS